MVDLKYAIVCVDDDPSILQVLGFQLHKYIDGNCVFMEFFSDPLEAYENIGELLNNQIDIIFILVDYQMPGLNGADLIRKIKALNPGLKCIMLSGQANAIKVDELVSDNLLEAFISKPWEESELLSAIKPLVEEKNIGLKLRIKG
jgi:CheY-like chemotaxis protein